MFMFEFVYFINVILYYNRDFEEFGYGLQDGRIFLNRVCGYVVILRVIVNIRLRSQDKGDEGGVKIEVRVIFFEDSSRKYELRKVGSRQNMEI